MNPVIKFIGKITMLIGEMRFVKFVGKIKFAEMFGPHIDAIYTDTEKEITLYNIKNGYRKFPICFTPIVDLLLLEEKATLKAARRVKRFCE